MPASTLLDAIDQQCRTIAGRLIDDVDHLSRKKDPVGFISYPLYDSDRKPLRESTLNANNVTLDGIEASAGYQKIMALCDRKYFRLTLELYLDFANPAPGRGVRLTVDGW